MDDDYPDDDYPFFGREVGDHGNAPFVILRCLAHLGLSDWATTLMHWLGRYDGLEQHLHREYDPARNVRDVLTQLCVSFPRREVTQPLSAQERRLLIEAITHQLLQLTFLRVRAHWGPWGVKKVIWDPLAMDFLAFLALGPDSRQLRNACESDKLDALQVWTKSLDDPRHEAMIRHILLEEAPMGESGAAATPNSSA
ncbi:MAG: hypothetical protein ACLGJD_25810 [Gammaproteobacteria bacterium]|uniref:hypothetical protein n=1 Tax=uncultured Pseudacidovorax sp. TaxID=679313 RepID=UPI0025CDDBA3|nr:hypothetical protein [uncultured Pseudacidovorax sp.]